jgi:hypothetical protein
MADLPVIDSGLPPVPPDTSNQTVLTPKTQAPATTAGGERGEESASENTAVSNTGIALGGGGLLFGSDFARRLSNSFQTNLENEVNKNFTNVKFPKGAHNRPRSNSIGETSTLESMKRNQVMLVGAVNSITLGLSDWFTDQERQTASLKEQVTDLSNQLKQANTNQGGQMLSLGGQVKALTDQLEQTNNTLKHLVTSEVSLSDTTGLQEDVQAMGDVIKKAVQQEAERNIRSFRATGDDIVSAIKQAKGDVQMSSPEHKKRKTPPIQGRQLFV